MGSHLRNANKKTYVFSHTYALLISVGAESTVGTRFNLSLPVKVLRLASIESNPYVKLLVFVAFINVSLE